VEIGESAAAIARKVDPYRDLSVIDARAPRFNQAFVALTSWIALMTGAWWVAGLMGLQLAIGLVFGRQYCISCLVYFGVIQPLFGKGEIEDARPPRFANILGATFLLSASLAHIAGLHTLGWALVVMVAGLATVAVVTGFCMGCTVYRIAARLRGVGSRARDHVDPSDFPGLRERSIIQFTHPLCTDCGKLERELLSQGREPVVVDVTRDRGLAHKYGVTVVPFAFEVASDGRVLTRLA
jgi:hypothetical protein